MHGIKIIPTLHSGRGLVPDHTLDIREYCSSCPVRVGEWILLADLLALHRLGEFDVVLGMDWLMRYHATIDCESRIVLFRESVQEEFVFRGCRSSLFAMTIFSTRAKQLIRSACVAYLATVMDRSGETLRIEDISTVQEFADVFLAELPRMPPDRD